MTETETYLTPITAADFANAKSGSKIKDANGQMWTFTDKPTSVTPLISRWMKNCNGDVEEITYTTMFGQNNLVDEELGIILELNVANVSLVP